MQASAQTNRTLGGLPYKWTVVIVSIFGQHDLIFTWPGGSFDS
jgi:hypothetical protein